MKDLESSNTRDEFTITPPSRAFELSISEIWKYRELVYFFVWKDIKVRYKQTLIGVAWAVIQPLFLMLVFSLFFGVLAGLPSDDLPFAVFYFAGLVVWTYFANSINTATNIMVDQQRVITRVYFPRLVLPLSAVLSGLLDLGIASVVLLVISVVFGFPPSWSLLALFLFVAMAVGLALAVGIWTSALNALYRDVRYAVPLLLQLWLFASPVAYATSLVPESWQTLYHLNPMVTILDGFRWSVVGSGSPPTLTSIGLSIGVTVILIVTGLVYFTRTETRIVDVV